MSARDATPAGTTVRLDDLQSLPPTLDIETAAALLGIGRTLAYQLAKEGRFPCRVLRVGRRYLIPTGGLIRLLGPPASVQEPAADLIPVSLTGHDSSRAPASEEPS
jgi:excisionase family DNA binding protein